MGNFRLSSFACLFAGMLAHGPLYKAGAQQQTSPEVVADPLLAGFQEPPSTARPEVWWHWVNGNVTPEGIALDLPWMKRAGLGGFQLFDGNIATSKVVPKPRMYWTPEWNDAFRQATRLAGELGLEEGISSSPGWSETGGPWVKPRQAMKKYVWSEVQVAGGSRVTAKLPSPPTVTGPFQDMPLQDAGGLFSVGNVHTVPPAFFADVAVVAYRTPESATASAAPVVTASSGALDPAMLNHGGTGKGFLLKLPPQVGDKAWIQFAYPVPTTIRSLTIVSGRKGLLDNADAPSGQALEVSDDGVQFRPVLTLPLSLAPQRTMSFAPITARYFRVTFAKGAPVPNPLSFIGMGGPTNPAPVDVPIQKLTLEAASRVERFEEKAAFVPAVHLQAIPTTSFAKPDVIAKDSVIDLSAKMQPDGTLDWIPPAGNWTILRFGYSLLGTTNHPESPEGTGLEVDKLNGLYVREYMETYLDKFSEILGPGMTGTRGIQTMVSDSWEAGAQNWTDDMIAQFTRRRGYSPLPWMPVLAGYVVESSQASDRFLWDLRKTIADLIADEHYGQMQAALVKRGITRYGESHEDGRAIIADGMEVKKLADVPMGAMWTQTPGDTTPSYDFNADDRESASVSHLYGRRLTAAESMTVCNPSTGWSWFPSMLKQTVDQEFINGINKIVIHESAEQPFVNKTPGVSLGPCGLWFNRNDTWAEHARPWTDYLARNSYLLQQGAYAADILYFYGEDSNLTAVFHTSSPAVPPGVGFDYVNADALIHEFHVSDGQIQAKSGMRYRLLYLDPNSRSMSLPVLRAIAQLVAQGAVIAGQRPETTPSLADDEVEFSKLRNELFPETDREKKYKHGRYAGQTIASALASLRVAPDFQYTGVSDAGQVEFLHRHLPDGEAYLLNNRANQPANLDADFRVSGRVPELWHAETGITEPVSYRSANGRTHIPIQLEPWGSVFVVFRQKSRQPERTVRPMVTQKIADITGPWTVDFQPGLGAPPQITLKALSSWTENSDPGVKYFSGTAVYRQTITAPAEWIAGGKEVWLDLGDVKSMAVVSVNGKEVGTSWHAPYRVNVSSALRPGSNELSVQVINGWANRMIGDQQPETKAKYTYTTWKSYKADSPLQPAGLLGPVSLETVSRP